MLLLVPVTYDKITPGSSFAVSRPRYDL